MRNELLYHKKIKSFLSIAVLFLITLLLTGCATLSYSGDDYNVNNVETVKTSEDFIFDVYKKSLENINLKIGITKSPVNEILAIYVKVENLSYETPYVFRVEDLKVSNPETNIKFITSSNYLNIYQTQESSSMNAMGSMGSALTNMTGMMANYNDFNQTMVQNASEETNKTAYSKMEELGNRISNHSIKVSATISPRKSQYFYFFIENMDKFPIYINYKGLNYQFKL